MRGQHSQAQETPPLTLSRLGDVLISELKLKARRRPLKLLLYPHVWLSRVKLRRLDNRIALLTSIDGGVVAGKPLAAALAKAKLPREVWSRAIAVIANNRDKDSVDRFFEHFAEEGSANMAIALQAGGQYREAAGLAAKLLADPNRPNSERKVLAALPCTIIETLALIEEGRPRAIKGISGHIAYVAASSLPYNVVGYTTRTHGVAQGFIEAGYTIDVITRPSFPLNMGKNLDPRSIPEVEVYDGVTYHRILKPEQKKSDESEYVRLAADALEAKFRQLRPSIVIAGSNYMNSLPALIAAKRAGLPFVYEVRGMWELSRVSAQPSFEHTPEFAVMRILESEVARRSDFVLTLSNPMQRDLISRGVSKDKIALMPNGIKASAVRIVDRDSSLAQKLAIPDGVPVIGYVGSILQYEGLPDLASACVGLAKRGLNFRLIIVGEENKTAAEPTPITDEIRKIFRDGGCSDRLIMPGRVPFSEVYSYYSLIDVAPLPRRSFKVCELVSPIKPIEALAMGKVLIVSDVEALQDFVQGGTTGLQFEKGSVADLEAKLALALSDPALRSALSAQGQEFVRRSRTWPTICRSAAKQLSFLAQGETDRR